MLVRDRRAMIEKRTADQKQGQKDVVRPKLCSGNGFMAIEIGDERYDKSSDW